MLYYKDWFIINQAEYEILCNYIIKLTLGDHLGLLGCGPSLSESSTLTNIWDDLYGGS